MRTMYVYVPTAGPPIKNGQGRVREGSGVGFRVRLFVRVSLQGLYGRVSFKG